MATVASAIEDKIAELLAADDDLSDVARFVKGMLYRVPDDWFPLCEINVLAETQAREETGAYDIIDFSGTIRFDVRMNDAVTTSENIVTEVNQRQLKEYIQAARRVFRDADNRRLGSLSGANWAVRDIVISRNVEYGLDARRESQNDFEFIGTVPFAVRVQEQNV